MYTFRWWMICLIISILCWRGWRRNRASSRFDRRPQGRRLGWDYRLRLIWCGCREAWHSWIRRARPLCWRSCTSTHMVDRGEIAASSAKDASEHLINQLSINHNNITTFSRLRFKWSSKRAQRNILLIFIVFTMKLFLFRYFFYELFIILSITSLQIIFTDCTMKENVNSEYGR